MKGILFDIDGTLLKSYGGLGRIPFEISIEKVTGKKINLSKVDWLGRTDLDVIWNVLLENNFKEEYIKNFIPLIFEEYINNFKIFSYKNIDKFELIPNVKNLLELIKEKPIGLLTGNLKETAHIKLEILGINNYFPFGIGGYGDEDRDRSKLVLYAINRMKNYYKNIDDFIIIGDSFRDILCAKKNKIKILAVATGKNSYDELKKYNPDFLEKDFSDLKKIINYFE